MKIIKKKKNTSTDELSIWLNNVKQCERYAVNAKHTHTHIGLTGMYGPAYRVNAFDDGACVCVCEIKTYRKQDEGDEMSSISELECKTNAVGILLSFYQIKCNQYTTSLQAGLATRRQ